MIRRRTAPPLALLLLLAGCGREAPETAPPAPADPAGSTASEEASAGDRPAPGDGGSDPATPAAGAPSGAGDAEPPAETSADCSAATMTGDLPAQPELPPAVAARRRAIHAAATRCDFAALDELAPPELRYSFGENVDAVEAWRQREAEGDPVLRWMAAVLRARPERQHGLWVWPGFFTRAVAEWTAEDRREARRLLGDDFEMLTGSGAYLGYRVGIAADGTWQYFVAGD